VISLGLLSGGFASGSGFPLFIGFRILKLLNSHLKSSLDKRAIRTSGCFMIFASYMEEIFRGHGYWLGWRSDSVEEA